MNTLLFIIVLSCMAIVLVWYVENEDKGASGRLGLLAIKDDENTKEQAKNPYRPKTPSTPDSGVSQQAVPQDAKPAYREIKEKRGFRAVSNQDDDGAP